MGVYIKGMGMPESGYIDVRLHTYADGRQCATISIGKHPYYKEMDVVEVPEPHGRFIDAEALSRAIDKKAEEPEYQHVGEDWVSGLYLADELVWEQLTVIEEEE